MNVYAWIAPAIVPGVPVDHTWVTTYDSRKESFPDIRAVIAHHHNFWFCWGDFRPQGTPPEPIVDATTSASSECLVVANTKPGKGTIQWYGIHGVCHQASNQVLYPANQRVSAARGYRASSAIWNSYGTRDRAWHAQLAKCSVLAPGASRHRRSALILYGRARYYLDIDSPLPRELERRRQILLEDLEAIGFAARGPDETRLARVARLNQRIALFFDEAATLLEGWPGVFRRLFGFEPGTVVNLIDPELFQFPQATDND